MNNGIWSKEECVVLTYQCESTVRAAAWEAGVSHNLQSIG